jgi:dihydropteroate synthase
MNKSSISSKSSQARNEMLDAIHDHYSQPLLMGIINRTPDSFSDGGQLYDFDDPDNLNAALERIEIMVAAGASIIDIGGESTRPGAVRVTAAEEAQRILPLLRELCKLDNCWISVDTQRAGIAQAAIDIGAHLINDVSAGLNDPQMFNILAKEKIPTVLMHMQGRPDNMQTNPEYQDVCQEVFDFLIARKNLLLKKGLDSPSIILDPGIGFGKTLAQNLQLLASLDSLTAAGQAVLLGVSRKSFIAAIDENCAAQVSNPAERIGGSIAALLAGAASGVRILRVHDIAESRQALDVFMSITKG